MQINYFPELQELSKLEELAIPNLQVKTIDTIQYQGMSYPIKSIIIGPEDKSLPTFGLFGGVHGLERIGSQVLLAFFHSFIQHLIWDQDLQKEIQNFRIVSIPIVNPVGVARFSRSNGNNVDLMRNAPVEAEGKTIPLASGHRISPKLPWFRGNNGIEQETKILFDFVKEEMFGAESSIALDVHSGFGTQDQVWYPYAKKIGGFPKEQEALLLKKLLDNTFPNHIYKFEPQSINYLTHGDIWDYLFDLHHKEYNDQKLFLPLTLELGSWNWIRKNPLQFFSKSGFFHPVKPHRHARIMRRHLVLLNFLSRATRNHASWQKIS